MIHKKACAHDVCFSCRKTHALGRAGREVWVLNPSTLQCLGRDPSRRRPCFYPTICGKTWQVLVRWLGCVDCYKRCRWRQAPALHCFVRENQRDPPCRNLLRATLHSLVHGVMMDAGCCYCQVIFRIGHSSVTFSRFHTASTM